MKILKRLAYVVLTPFVLFGIFVSIVLALPYWIFTGENFVALYVKNTEKLSDYLRGEKK